MDSSRNDFLTQYKAISAKLKKRFLRKPNISEASVQFGILAKELENQECPHYAAFCCLAVARCELTVENSIGESQNLLQAARLFLEAEQLSHQLLCPSFSEHLQAAISAYNHCVKVYIDSEQPALAAALSLEIGQALQQLGRINEAVPHYFKAAELHANCALDYIHDLKLVHNCRILTGDYDGALSMSTEIYCIAEQRGIKETGERLGVFASILGEAEVSRLLLLLFLKPPEFKMKPEHAKLLAKYSNIYSEPADYLDENLYLMLQSLVIAVREKDEASLLHLEKDLWSLLTSQQSEILNKILEQNRECGLPVPVD